MTRRFGVWAARVFAGALSLAAGADPAPATAWVNVSDPLLAKLAVEGKKTAWPGVTAGVACDRASGEVFVIVPGQGLFRSADKGATLAHVDESPVTGRCETGYAITADTRPGRVAYFTLDGKGGITLDGGKTWAAFKDVGRNWDYAAVDWSAESPQTILAMAHETGGQLMLSTDGGKAWAKIDKDKNFSALGVADATTLLATKGEGIVRSTDLGKTWAKASDFTPVGRLMVTMNGVNYWIARDAIDPAAKPKGATPTFLIVSKDKGATWAKQGATLAEAAGWGPYFGKDEKHLVTATRKGLIVESRDGGQTWADVIALPAKGYETGNPGWFLNLAYDPAGDVFYVSKMGQATLKWERGGK